MAVTAVGHPLGAREMTLPSPPCAFGLALGIDVQHDPCDLAPIRPFSVRVEKTQIGHKMLLVVTGQDGLDWGGISHGWIEGRLGHRSLCYASTCIVTYHHSDGEDGRCAASGA